MRKTLLAIVGVLVAPLALASQAGAWPGDDYYYAPYPPAVVVLPPPLYAPAPYYAPPSYYAPPVPAYELVTETWFNDNRRASEKEAAGFSPMRHPPPLHRPAA